MKDKFADVINSLGAEIHAVNRVNGWWDKERNPYELIALMHSELSEAVEYLRKGNPKSDHINCDGVTEEMADTIIRILDFCAGTSVDIGRAIMEKTAFNAKRGYRHGGKQA